MGDRWENNRRRFEPNYDQRREDRRERDNPFYRRSNRSFGDNWRNDSSTQNYNNDSYRKRNDDSNGTNSFVMYIDTNSVGRVIGKGGSKIKALQEESNAMIKVDKTIKCLT